MSIVTFDQSKQSELDAFIAANQPCHVWHDGAVTRVYTGEDMPVQVVASSVTPRQIRLALTQTGLRTTVENAVKAGSQDLKDWWEYALEVERNHPLIVSMAAQLGVTEQQLDGLFTLAAGL